MFTSIDDNSRDNLLEGAQVLRRLLTNIVSNPDDAKYRVLNLQNKTVASKLLSLSGIQSLLLSIGYKQDPVGAANIMVLDSAVTADKLQHILCELSRYSDAVAQSNQRNIHQQCPAEKPVVRFDKPYRQRISFASVLNTDNPFLRQIESQSDHVQQYEDAALLAYGRSLIPLERLRLQTTLRMRSLQSAIKTGASGVANCNNEPCFRDLMLAELVDWFRGSFFEWVNALPCPVCANPRPASRGAGTVDGDTRVELSECCGQTLQFRRYNDVAQLMRTRRGRCGEFANAFTFLCRCLGYEARLVVATFDHVWTEVYSGQMGRWLHVDPSDGVLDAPLMYQHGWRRAVDYVLAYSRHDVQDVTHRYCNAHTELPTKRTRCSEAALLDALIALRRKRQANCSQAQRRYLDRRALMELADLMTPGQLRENELNGRSSGDSMWKMARGESVATDVHVFQLNDIEITEKQFNLRYSAAKNQYERYITVGAASRILQTTSEWDSCILQHANIARKVEHDWKMSYLCRSENSSNASISWKFDFKASGLRIKSLSLQCATKTYEDGVLNVELHDENGRKVQSAGDLADGQGFVVACKLSGGRGDVAWQHTQLFRQPTNCKEYPFEVRVQFV